MNYCVYIIQSQKSVKFYIGSTGRIIERLEYHNIGKVVATKNKGPWRIIYEERFSSRSEAVRRKKQIKSYKGGEVFRFLTRRGMA